VAENSLRVVLTGNPGVGKTTVVRNVIRSLPRIAGGFYTEEIREKGRRVGFRIRTLDGEEGILAHISLKGQHKVGRYCVNVGDLEKVGVSALRRAMEREGIVVVDEIAAMELCSSRFEETVRELFQRGQPVLAVVQRRRKDFMEWISNQERTKIINVTEQDRDALPLQITRLFCGDQAAEDAGPKNLETERPDDRIPLI